MPDFWLLEVGRVLCILEFYHDMVWEKGEILQRLHPQSVILVPIHNHSRCLWVGIGPVTMAASCLSNQSPWQLLIMQSTPLC